VSNLGTPSKSLFLYPGRSNAARDQLRPKASKCELNAVDSSLQNYHVDCKLLESVSLDFACSGPMGEARYLKLGITGRQGPGHRGQ